MMHAENISDSSYDTTLAIIGMTGRFPGAPDVETLWQNITAGVKSIRFFSDEELLAAGVDPELLRQPNYVKAGTVLDGAEYFDASFFQFSPREAEIMDPQHRLFLEGAWQALEDAGYNPETYAGLIGVFSGSALSTYLLNNIYNNPALVDTVGKVQISIGNDRDSLSSTVSYKLNLRGPSFAVQTFCSTSLVAVHLACQSLVNYECDMALAGGVAIQFPQVSGYLYEDGGIVSPDGVCRTFDSQAKGSVMANGLGVVTLKRYADALRDGDHIYALIRGSAINNDGNVRVSYTAPGLNGQSEVLLQALGNADVPIETIGYIEAHGTATMLGDTVELAAMKKAFAAHTTRQQFCAIGSIKPNIGHLDRASGVTGLIKTALALYKKQLPPSLNFEHANPEVDLEHSPFYVNTTLTEWPEQQGVPRRAGVSSFGLGGTNAHVVLEEAPLRTSGAARSSSLLLLSAKSSSALETMTAHLATYLAQHPEAQLADVAYTLQVGRSAFNQRRMVVCRERDEAIRLLSEVPDEQVLTAYQTRRDREIVLLLPSSLPDARRSLRELAAEEPLVHEIIETCASFLLRTVDLDLIAALHAADQADDAPLLTSALAFVLEYALIRLLAQWGVRPQAVYGRGIGECVAACVAGIVELEGALLQALLPHLAAGGSALPLPSVTFQAPQASWISSISGTFVTAEQASDPAYWQQVMGGSPLAFPRDSVIQTLSAQNALFLEIGMGSSEVYQQLARRGDVALLACFDSGAVPQSVYARLLRCLGQLWLSGATLDWAGFSAREQRLRLSLPTYPFERQRYWIDGPGKDSKNSQATSIQPTQPAARKANLADWFYQPGWEERALSSPTASLPARTWLLFEDSCGVSYALAARLRAKGHEVMRVTRGAAFAHPTEYEFTLRPDVEDDYRTMCRLLRATGHFPTMIFHAWNVEREDLGSDFATQQLSGYYSLLFLSRALNESYSEAVIQTLVLATALQQVKQQELLAPPKATILGACAVLAQEYLTFSYRSLDLDLAMLEQEHLAEMLLAEFAAPSSERTIAYRSGLRYVQTYRPLHLESNQPPLRQRGVYLITGGLGGIGMVLADYLARAHQARLVLVSRSAFPVRQDWPDWLSVHEPDEPVARQIRQFQAMEELGAEILLLQADVAESEQMQEVVRQVTDHFGVLHGVLHAAGITDPAAFHAAQKISVAQCEQHFRPKVQGTYALARALEGQRLDFCLLFSSVSAVLGGLGFVAYAAANCFLDAFAAAANHTSAFPWISVNWDTWRVKENAHGALGATVAVFEMTPEEGVQAFTRVIGSGLTHLVNSTGDLTARMQQWLYLDSLAAVKAPSEPESVRVVPLASSDYERVITEIWQQILGVAQIGLYDNFFDLGGNSLIALQVIAQMKKAFHTQIPAVALFEAPTISALVNYCLAEIETEQPAAPVTVLPEPARKPDATDASEIAIVAMSGRFPGASSVEAFWENLRAGVESIKRFSDEELLAAGVDPAQLTQPDFVKARPILDDVEQFDASFFGYSPREAALTDPQHRLFLEVCWEALERAGYDPQRFPGLIGVFAGANISTYLLGMLRHPEVLPADNYQAVIGNDKDSLTTTVSYKLNLRGPSFAVQTFCSTALVAVHLASQSLRQGECDLALAGGASIRVPTVAGYVYQEGGMESADGHCRTFDAQASGTLFGDGVGVVVLKRLSDALTAGDQILAVLKGSAINNDGSLKVSYTAPSVVGQSQVIERALKNAGVSAASLSYIEAHGTATELGDPIEVSALTKAFRKDTEQQGYCAIGSVKTNIGHLDRAAGISGLIKTVLALKHQEIPPSLHFVNPNPEIDFARSPFYVNTRLTSWVRGTEPRRAGVNSLGMGGTNVHVVLEEAPPQDTQVGESRPLQLLTWSARTPQALEAQTTNLLRYLEEHAELPLADVAYTLQVGRQRFEQRRTLVCRTRDEALAALRGERWKQRRETRQERGVAFLLPGMGEQFRGMGQELYTRETHYRQAIERGLQLLAQIDAALERRVRAILLEPREARKEVAYRFGMQRDAGNLTREQLVPTEAHPALFLSEYAQARLWMHWGIQPRALLGYSLGEYVAACLAEVLTLEDALKLVVGRARLLEATQPGAMLAVMLSEHESCEYLSPEVSLGAVNAPETCVLSGSVAGIELVKRQLTLQGVAFQQIATTHALHSCLMEPLRSQMEELARGVVLHTPRIPYISNVSGTWITAEQACDPAYWGEHLCRPVRLLDSLGLLLENEELALAEIGHGRGLGSFARQHSACAPERFGQIVSTLPGGQGTDDQEAMLETLGVFWLLGCDIGWQQFSAEEQRRRLCLPTYPFERQRHWIDLPADRPIGQMPHLQAAQADLPPEVILSQLKKAELADWFYLPTWKNSAPPTAHLETGEDANWLVFTHPEGIGEKIFTSLRRTRRNVIRVLPGENFSLLDATTCVVRPAVREDLTQLLKTLSKQGKKPAHIVHCWSALPEIGELDTTLEQGFYSLQALAQALGDIGSEACRISVVSSAMQDVSGNERIDPARATLLGPCKVIPQEYPALHCQSIDITLPTGESWQEERLLAQIMDELCAREFEPVVALRGDRRWTPAFEPVSFPTSQTASPRWRTRGVYLITGGSGGIGLALAEHLARSYQARLVLVARTPFPPRSEWPALLRARKQERQIRQMLLLEELGAEVVTLQADVASEAQMRGAIADTLAHFGALHGVIHAAGVPGVGLMQLKTPEQAAQVMAPKVQGTLVLESVLRDLPLDFLLLFSSVTAITGGGPGQVDYCAANAFLDAYARQNVTRHGITLAINWGEWQWNAWEAGLSGYDQATASFFRANRQQFGISFEEGAEALQRVLTKHFPQVIVSTQDFRVLADLSKAYTAASMLQRKLQTAEHAGHARPALSSEYAAPRSELERQITSVWEHLLGIVGIGVADNFFDLGGNSLVGLELISRLRQELSQADLPSYVLFEAPTVSALAQYIEQNSAQGIVEERLARGGRRRASLQQRVAGGTHRSR